MLGYLSADIICSEKRPVFRERSSRKTVSFEEQIMSKDKYPSIFSQPNRGYCVYYPSVLKIGEFPRIFPSFSWEIFAHVTRLDQSRASENIWWIIINSYSSRTRRIWADIYNQRGRRPSWLLSVNFQAKPPEIVTFSLPKTSPKHFFRPPKFQDKKFAISFSLFGQT